MWGFPAVRTKVFQCQGCMTLAICLANVTHAFQLNAKDLAAQSVASVCGNPDKLSNTFTLGLRIIFLSYEQDQRSLAYVDYIRL